MTRALPALGSALVTLLGIVMLSGCGLLTLPRELIYGPPVVMPPGRVLVIPRKGPEGRAVADGATRRVLESLRESFDVIGAAELMRRAPASALIIERLTVNGWPSVEEGSHLAALGIQALLVVEVTGYEQAWNGEGKVTRVGLIAESYVLPGGPPAWRIYRDARLGDHHGRAFQTTLDDAAAVLAGSIVPFKPVPGEILKPRVEEMPRPRAEGPRCC